MDERTTDLGLADPSVAARLAPLLVERRRALGRRHRTLASASAGRWTKRDLAEAEEGRRPLTPADVVDLAALYEVDVSAVLPQRHPLSVGDGVIRAGEIEACFVPGERASLLSAYVGLLQRLRGGAALLHLELRRADIVVLAAALGDNPDQTIAELVSIIQAGGGSRVAGAADAGVVVLPLRAELAGRPASEMQRLRLPRDPVTVSNGWTIAARGRNSALFQGELDPHTAQMGAQAAADSDVVATAQGHLGLPWRRPVSGGIHLPTPAADRPASGADRPVPQVLGDVVAREAAFDEGIPGEVRVDEGVFSALIRADMPVDTSVIELDRSLVSVRSTALGEMSEPIRPGSPAGPSPVAVPPVVVPQDAVPPAGAPLPRRVAAHRVDELDPLTLLLGLPAPRSRGASVVDEAFGAFGVGGPIEAT